jgi:hypothetical protein
MTGLLVLCLIADLFRNFVTNVVFFSYSIGTCSLIFILNLGCGDSIGAYPLVRYKWVCFIYLLLFFRMIIATYKYQVCFYSVADLCF